MQHTTEAPVKEQIRNELNVLGVYFTMPPANGYGRAGGFDFTCCVKGRFLGIEAKRDYKEQPTALQHDNADKARLSGGVVLLIHKDNVELVRTTVTAMYKSDHPVRSYWPARQMPAADDIPAPKLRRKRP
jgi:hypothetical protein